MENNNYKSTEEERLFNYYSSFKDWTAKEILDYMEYLRNTLLPEDITQEEWDKMQERGDIKVSDLEKALNNYLQLRKK